jgi:hypothetical protein
MWHQSIQTHHLRHKKNPFKCRTKFIQTLILQSNVIKSKYGHDEVADQKLRCLLKEILYSAALLVNISTIINRTNNHLSS